MVITDRSNYCGNKSILTGNGYLLSNKHIFEDSLYKKYEELKTLISIE